MNKLQIIKSPEGQNQYVRLPMSIYQSLLEPVEPQLTELDTYLNDDDYVLFDPADYVENPVALARINAGLTRPELANKLGISVAYLGNIERRAKVSNNLLARVTTVIQESNSSTRSAKFK